MESMPFNGFKALTIVVLIIFGIGGAFFLLETNPQIMGYVLAELDQASSCQLESNAMKFNNAVDLIDCKNPDYINGAFQLTLTTGKTIVLDSIRINGCSTQFKQTLGQNDVHVLSILCSDKSINNDLTLYVRDTKSGLNHIVKGNIRIIN